MQSWSVRKKTGRAFVPFSNSVCRLEITRGLRISSEIFSTVHRVSMRVYIRRKSKRRVRLAGVVVDGSLHAENLPWVLDGAAIARKLHLNKVELLNDLAATALSLEHLDSSDFAILNEGIPQPDATKAVIAAGTGLGEATLHWDGQQYRVAPSEGGQAEFAPRGQREIQLLSHLNKLLPQVSCEDIISAVASQDP